MDIEIYSLLATSILLISLATIVFSIYSYVLFRVREGRKLKKTAGHGHGAAEHMRIQPAAEALADEAAAGDESVLEAGLAALAAAAGESVGPQPAPPVKSSSGSGRFFKPYNPGT